MQALVIPLDKQLTRTKEALSPSDLEEIWKKVRNQELQYVDLSYHSSPIEHLIVPADLPHLKYLYLYESQIQKITFEDDLPQLKILHLGKNQLKEFELPKGFGRLQHLRLDNNDLQQLELENVAALVEMKSLFLEGNKLQDIPKEHWDKEGDCWQSVQAYLQAAATGLILNNEAKVIWFGNGKAGKTTLSHQIRKGEFKDFKRTHGIQIKNWKIPYKRLPQKLQNRMTDSIKAAKAEAKKNKQKAPKISLPKYIVLKLWDFGGQEYYHATHRLFLNSNVLYLLVWNEDTDFQHESLDPSECIYPRSYWKYNIQYYTQKEEPILEIQNKAQEHSHTNPSELQYKVAYRNPEEELDLEAYGLDVKILEKAIISQLHRLIYLGKTFPEVYDHIRKQLRKLTQPCLSFDDYVVFCRLHDSTQDKDGIKGKNLLQKEVQIEELIKFLHDTGTIICYRYQVNCPELLKDYVFIRPQWVTDTIYKILNKKLVKKKKTAGEFDLQRVAKATQNTGLSAETWVALMKQFQLIFEIECEGKTRYIAPQYLPMKCQNKKTMRWALNIAKPVHGFSLHFPRFLPKSHFLQFVVAFGPQSVDYLYWKNGLIFTKNGLVIYAQCNYNDHQIRFSIGKGEKPRQQQTLQELYQWFIQNDKLTKHTEVSVDGEYFVPIELLKENRADEISVFKHDKHKFDANDFWFVFGRHLEGGRIGKTAPTPPVSLETIQKWLQKGKLPKAITAFLGKATQENREEYIKELSLLSSRYHTNENKNRNQLRSSDDYDTENGKITYALWQFLGNYQQS